MDTARHQGHIALVTGAASGIGRATMLRLAGEGATVVGFDVNEEALTDVQAAASQAGAAVSLTVGDITKQTDIDRIVGDTLQEHGRIDLLANVAGIMDWFLPAHEVDDETWDRVMAVNTGPLKLCRAGAVPRSEFGMARLAPIHGTAVRMAQPDEIATLVSWLSSDEAANVNGAIIDSDGGWAAG